MNCNVNKYLTGTCDSDINRISVETLEQTSCIQSDERKIATEKSIKIYPIIFH